MATTRPPPWGSGPAAWRAPAAPPAAAGPAAPLAPPRLLASSPADGPAAPLLPPPDTPRERPARSRRVLAVVGVLAAVIVLVAVVAVLSGRGTGPTVAEQSLAGGPYTVRFLAVSACCCF